MTDELKKELLKFANDRAIEVEDISIGQLEDLVVAGAEWMHNKLAITTPANIYEILQAGAMSLETYKIVNTIDEVLTITDVESFGGFYDKKEWDKFISGDSDECTLVDDFWYVRRLSIED